MKNKTGRFFVLMAACGAITLGAALTMGSVKIPLAELFLPEHRAIVQLRILRIVTAIAAGSGLAASGVALQALLRNPLAEPYLLGTSSGAGLGAIIAVLAGLSGLYLPLAAFAGALASVLIVYRLALQHNRLTDFSLVLSGVIVSVAASALIVFFISISSNEAVHGFNWWLWGSLQVSDIRLLAVVCAVVCAGTLVIFCFAQDLNAMSLGEEEAAHSGIEVERTKKLLIAVTALITASLVCICGIIGFVGLIVPHMMRMLIGPHHRRLIPASCLGGAIFMVASDTVSRTLAAPIEIPIGVITALIGAPTFMFLLRKSEAGRP